MLRSRSKLLAVAGLIAGIAAADTAAAGLTGGARLRPGQGFHSRQAPARPVARPTYGATYDWMNARRADVAAAYAPAPAYAPRAYYPQAAYPQAVAARPSAVTPQPRVVYTRPAGVVNQPRVVSSQPRVIRSQPVYINPEPVRVVTPAAPAAAPRVATGTVVGPR